MDILWGYATGIVVTQLPDKTEVVLAERTRPFNESDASYFFPLINLRALARLRTVAEVRRGAHGLTLAA